MADRDRIVVMMSIDGLANFYMDDPAAPMPTIRQLASEGAKAAGMRASDPTVTWPNHTTLVTGVPPARHGVVGNSYFNRVKGERVTVIWDPALDKDEVVKVPTIYDVAKAAGLKTAAVHWPATRNARSLDWTIPDVMKNELVQQFTTPGLLDECKAAGLDLVYDDSKTRKRNESTAEDDAYTGAFNLILTKHRPNLALFHVLAVDHTQHLEGPRTAPAYEAIKAADGQVRQIWEVLQRDFPGKATMIIVSDHGFSLNKTRIAPNEILQKAGLVEMTGDHVTGGQVQLAPQGGSALVYVMDQANRDSIIKRFKQAFANVEGISKIVGVDEFSEYGIGDPRRDPHMPDMLLFAKMGYYFGDAAPPPASRSSRAATGTIRICPICTPFSSPGGPASNRAPSWASIENTRVAPTIAKLLGVEIPNAEGKPLAEALAE